jgi:hypothetical protein
MLHHCVWVERQPRLHLCLSGFERDGDIPIGVLNMSIIINSAYIVSKCVYNCVR